MDYCKKYLKYKYKYIKLKKIINGGTFMSDIIFETENFYVKKSKTFQLYDFYYKVKNRGVDSTGKIKNVYSEVLDIALASTKENLDQLYDPAASRHYCNYMAEKIYGGSDCHETNICQNWDIVWSPEVNFVFELALNETETDYIIKDYSVKIIGVTGGLMSKEINLEKYILQLLNSDKKWIIIPLGVPGHSVSIIIYKNNKNIYEIYFNDPNGKMDNDRPSELKTYINFVRKFFKKFCSENNYIYNDYLLCELEPQGGTTLMYIDTQGFCGAFTWMIIFLIIINGKNDLTPKKLYEYFTERQSQWNNLEDEVDYKDILDKLVDKFINNEYFNKYLIINLNMIDSTVNYTINNKVYLLFKKEYDKLIMLDNKKKLEKLKEKTKILNKRKLIKYQITQPNGESIEKVKILAPLEKDFLIFSEDEFNKEIYTSEFYENIILNIVKNIEEESKNKKKDLIELRKNLVESMDGNNYSLNWFESHIIIYLLFVKEFFDTYLPIINIDKEDEIYKDYEKTLISINNQILEDIQKCSHTIPTNNS